MRVLVTGFGPFGRVEDNPSARLATAAATRTGAEALVLPTSFARAPAALRDAARRGFDAMLLLGVAETESELRVETCGHNVVAARIADVDGAQPSGALVPGAAEVLPVTLSPTRLLAALAAPAHLSDTAGAYVCNALLFHALHERLAPAIGFLHVPPDERTFAAATPNAVPFEAQLAAVARAIVALA